MILDLVEFTVSLGINRTRFETVPLPCCGEKTVEEKLIVIRNYVSYIVCYHRMVPGSKSSIFMYYVTLTLTLASSTLLCIMYHVNTTR